ncbi:S8 family peptidase [Kitasatospora sp. NBC_01287]|uniref:S8 family peptidase n=1 Tax=Kitasatospora sp. NBC_01287 TaxID=2903573 RepID=UPI002250E9E5|nr:S8 family peptidase [Kitasatospora sp. NBC_01287]MCX4749180.1 S8 family peptidase [Kitasatospora sp. NBC_01287]
MRLSARCASAALMLIIPLAAAQSAAADGPSERAVAAPLHRTATAVPGEYIVTVDKGLDPARVAARAGGVKPLHTYRHVLNGFSARLDAAQLERVRALPGVEAVEENGRAGAQAATVSPTQDKRAVAASWGLDRIDQHDWDKDAGTGDGQFNVEGNGAGVTAYLVGTGIDFGHDEFEGRATLGTDTVGDGKNGADCNGVGTNVAGIVGGKTYGVARKVNLVSVRVVGCDGKGTAEQIIAGLDWVAANAKKPAVANISVGGDKDEALNKAATALSNAGIMPVVSGGNGARDACNSSPSSAERVITVGATDKYDEETDFSNYGTCVSLYAPGKDITSAQLGGGSISNSGTSMAAPHVTGTVALYLATHTDATPEDLALWLSTESTKDALTVTKSSPNELLYAGGL